MIWLKNFGAVLLIIGAFLVILAAVIGFGWILVLLYGTGHWFWATLLIIIAIAAITATSLTVTEGL